MRRRSISLADPLIHADHSPLRSSQMVVDTALERAEAELSNAVSTSAWIVDTALERPEAELSNAVSTSAWIVDTALERAEAELSNAIYSGEWLAFKSVIASAGIKRSSNKFFRF